MSSYLVDRFADILTSKDVLELFKRLEISLGSLRKAAIRCGLERKTIYDWRKTGNLRLPTKKKVLKSLLEVETEETLDYMAKRSRETAIELLSTYATTLYERALDPEVSSEDFQRLAQKFEQVRSENAGMIIGSLETEIGDMIWGMMKRAHELGGTYNPQPVEAVRVNRLATMMPAIIAEIQRELPFIDSPKLSRKFNLPLEFIEVTSRFIEEVVGVQEGPKLEAIPSRRAQHTASTLTPEPSPSEMKRLWGELPQTTPVIAT